MNKVELSNVVGGALQEKFNKSFERVIDNLQDQNTSFKVKRSITIKLTFEQNEERDDVSVSVDVQEKLAPQTGMKTSFAIGKDLKTGELYAEEYGKQVKGQTVMNAVREPEPLTDIPVDRETGEVLETKATVQVIDLRRAAQS